MRRENEYKSKLSKGDMMLRGLWNICRFFLFKPFPTAFFRPWRNFVLRLFGAKVHKRAGVYSSATIYAPWNLVMHNNAWIGPHVKIYNVDKIEIGDNVTISQYSYLCTASHDIRKKTFDLITAPIILKSGSWVAADAFIGMGVTVGEGAVIGARSAVFKDVEPWTVVGGNPGNYSAPYGMSSCLTVARQQV